MVDRANVGGNSFEGSEHGGKAVEAVPATGLGARLDFAMCYARMNGSMLRKALERDHGVVLTRSTLSKILRHKIRSSKYTMEIAETLGVNPKWLQTGRETITTFLAGGLFVIGLRSRVCHRHSGFGTVPAVIPI